MAVPSAEHFTAMPEPNVNAGVRAFFVPETRSFVEPVDYFNITNADGHMQTLPDQRKFGFMEVNGRTTVPQKDFPDNLRERSYSHTQRWVVPGRQETGVVELPFGMTFETLRQGLGKDPNTAFRCTLTKLSMQVSVLSRHGPTSSAAGQVDAGGMVATGMLGNAMTGAPAPFELRLFHTDLDPTQFLSKPLSYGSRLSQDRVHLLDPNATLWYFNSNEGGNVANLNVDNCSLRISHSAGNAVDNISSGQQTANQSAQGKIPMTETELQMLRSGMSDPRLSLIFAPSTDTAFDETHILVSFNFSYVDGWPTAMRVPLDDKTGKPKKAPTSRDMTPAIPEVYKDGFYWPVPLDARYADGEESLWGRRPYTRYLMLEEARGAPCPPRGCIAKKKATKAKRSTKCKAGKKKKSKAESEYEMYKRMKRLRALKKKKAAGKKGKRGKKTSRKC